MDTKELRPVLISAATMQAAIERAVHYRPLVTPMGERAYKVKSVNHDGYHYVEFYQNNEGRFGTCTCPAGEHGNPCYAMGAALIAHLGISKMRAASTKPRAIEADRRAEVDRARIERAEHRKRPAARFECDGIGRHEACGRKCKFAQRLGGIDI